MDLETNALAGMHNLRLLQISKVQLVGGYKQFPKNLRYLCWHGLPWKYVPRDFPLENIVAIDIRHSNIKEFSTGAKVLQHVKIINFSHCHCLTRTPEFSQFPSLERLILKDCVSLVEVHESIVEVEGLIFLNLCDCRSLKKIPNNIGKLKVLEILIISGCSNLEELPTDLKGMECLKVFCADGISLNTSQSTIEQEMSLRDLVWSLVLKPKRVPILSWDSLPHSLVCLSLANCNLSDDAFPSDFCNMPLLQNLDLSENPIYFLPDCVKCLKKLNELSLSSCTNLQSLIGLPSVENLTLEDCTSLEKITFQTPWCHSALANLIRCRKLVEMEGIFKVVPTRKVNEEMLNYMGLHACDLESIQSTEIMLYNSYTRSTNKGPIQGVYEYGGIFSIFLPGNCNIPGLFTHRKAGQSLSFIVPSSPSKARIKRLVVSAVYSLSGNKWDVAVLNYIVTEVYNDTKNMQLDFYPAYYAIPGEGEEIIWLSNWNFGSHHLEAGDEMRVIVYSETAFKVQFLEIKEVGVHFVYEDQEQMAAESNSQDVEVWYETWKNDET